MFHVLHLTYPPNHPHSHTYKIIKTKKFFSLTISHQLLTVEDSQEDQYIFLQMPEKYIRKVITSRPNQFMSLRNHIKQIIPKKERGGKIQLRKKRYK